jgi:hypothetical protein
MSMTNEYRTEIVVPKPQIAALQANIRGSVCGEILEHAFTKVAEEQGARLGSSYNDCSGGTTPCLLSLHGPKFSGGVGAVVDAQGKITFKFDEKSCDPAAARALCDDLARAYAVIAVIRWAQSQQMQFTVTEDQMQSTSGRTVRIRTSL